ncbi:hypothetical protein HYW21_00280 [Candidatus Woesearchaeota archaeon]|nr:hypothetical protein [Candidatus Woesearchaeota archaeon]
MKHSIVTDAHYMLLSIDEAISGLLRTEERYGNQVGCVLVGKNNNIIGTAHNHVRQGRRMHAEELLLAEVNGRDLSDATLYLTIEPCNGNPYHTRRHCCEQIAEVGIGRVVLGSLKHKYEGGADYLSTHGISVELLENDEVLRMCRMLTSNNPHAGENLPLRVIDQIMTARARRWYV